jgi:hypothetical protein
VRLTHAVPLIAGMSRYREFSLKVLFTLTPHDRALILSPMINELIFCLLGKANGTLFRSLLFVFTHMGRVHRRPDHGHRRAVLFPIDL